MMKLFCCNIVNNRFWYLSAGGFFFLEVFEICFQLRNNIDNVFFLQKYIIINNCKFNQVISNLLILIRFTWHVQLDLDTLFLNLYLHFITKFKSVHYSVTNNRYCRYSCLCSWWWVVVPLKASPDKINCEKLHLVGYILK